MFQNTTTRALGLYMEVTRSSQMLVFCHIITRLQSGSKCL